MGTLQKISPKELLYLIKQYRIPITEALKHSADIVAVRKLNREYRYYYSASGLKKFGKNTAMPWFNFKTWVDEGRQHLTEEEAIKFIIHSFSRAELVVDKKKKILYLPSYRTADLSLIFGDDPIKYVKEFEEFLALGLDGLNKVLTEQRIENTKSLEFVL